MMWDRRQAPNRTALLLVLALALAGSIGVVRNSFTNWDDPALVTENVQIRRLTPAGVLDPFVSVSDHAYMPLRTLSYMGDYALWGLDPFGFHLTNLLLHCANCVLVFVLLVRVLKDEWVALAASLIFAVHPVHAEAVAWVSGRKDLLVAFFSLLAVLSYWSGRSGALTALLAVCACLSKPTGVVLPLLIGVVEVLGSRDEATRAGRPARLYQLAPVVVACAVFLAVHLGVGLFQSVIKTTGGAGGTMGGRMIGMVAATACAVRVLWFPFNLTPFYLLDQGQVLPSSPLLTAIAVAATVGLMVWCLRAREPVMGLGLLWLGIAYLPTANIVRTSLPFAERYLYFPSLGFCLCLAAVVAKVGRRGEEGAGAQGASVAAAMLLGLLCVALLAGRWINNARWRDDLALWRSAARVLPSSSEVWNDLAVGYSEAGLMPCAEAALRRVAQLEPPNARLCLNRGLLLLKRKDYAGALKELPGAAAEEQFAFEAHYNMGRVYEALGRSREALAEYKTAATLAPQSPLPHSDMGVLLERSGDLRGARRAYETAIRLDPDYAHVYYNLGNVEQEMKDLPAAEAAYQKAIELDPDHAMALCNLAGIYLARREISLARDMFKAAADLDPTLVQPVLALAVIDAGQGRKEKALAEARRVLMLDPKNPTALRLIEDLSK